MNTIQPFLSLAITMILVLSTMITAAADNEADDKAARQLEAQALGYWAPDEEAMLKLYTGEKEIPKEDALALIEEGAKMTIHVEKGMVHLYTKQGILSLPYEIVGSDKASRTLTVRAVQPAAAGGQKAQPIELAIKEDQMTVPGGQLPFIIKRIKEDEFKKRKKILPAGKIGG